MNLDLRGKMRELCRQNASARGGGDLCPILAVPREQANLLANGLHSAGGKAAIQQKALIRPGAT
jgi:hypothetical protein